MLDLKLIRAEPDRVREAASRKRMTVDVDRILELDESCRERGVRIDELRSSQKSAGKAMGKASPEERATLLESQKVLKVELRELEQQDGPEREELRTLLLTVPNLPSAEVPDGDDDTGNVELRLVGEPRSFDFEPWSHIQLGEAHGWLDIEGGARLAGSRNYVLMGELAELESAVMRFALDHMLGKGFRQISVPTLVRREAMEGTGYFPGGEEQAYRTDDRDELFLVGTAEVPVTALHAGEILDLDRLPLRYVALSSCYRREAGTYGKDTKGLYRVHQFQKVEQVIIDVADEANSLEQHQAILGNSEEVLQLLGLPYRVVNVCGGDLGQPQIQKFDIETWMPSREGYGETHSASRFHDFQARRLNLRYRDGEGKARLCHTLNNTVAASTRMLIAVLENHQTQTGQIGVPEPLRPYLRGRELLGEPIRGSAS